MTTKEGDFVERLYVASAHSYVLAFTDSGKVFWVKVYDIPQAGPAAKGKAIVNLLNLSADEKVAASVAVRDFPDDKFLVFSTEQGTIKKTALAAYGNPRAGGIIAINIEKGDRLLDVRVTDGQGEILLATRNGFAIRFPETDVRPMGRDTTGVRGVALRKGDKVVTMEVLAPDATILTVAERGFGKRTDLDQYRVQSRGGLGIINLKVTPKTGAVVGVKSVRDEDNLMLITQSGQIIRIHVGDIRVIGRSTQGVKVMDLEGDDRLVAIAKVAERDNGDAVVGDEGGPEGGADGGGETPPEPDAVN